MGTGNGCYITHERALSGLVGPVGLISIAQLVEIVDPVAQSFVPHAYTNVREYVSIVVQGSMYMGFTYQLGCCLDSMLLYQVEIFSVRNQQLHAVGIVGAVSSWESTTHLFYFLNWIGYRLGMLDEVAVNHNLIRWKIIENPELDSLTTTTVFESSVIEDIRKFQKYSNLQVHYTRYWTSNIGYVNYRNGDRCYEVIKSGRCNYIFDPRDGEFHRPSEDNYKRIRKWRRSKNLTIYNGWYNVPEYLQKTTYQKIDRAVYELREIRKYSGLTNDEARVFRNLWFGTYMEWEPLQDYMFGQINPNYSPAERVFRYLNVEVEKGPVEKVYMDCQYIEVPTKTVYTTDSDFD